MAPTAQGCPVDAENVCPAFERVSSSLIEEPEICEFCEKYRDGYCFKEE